MISRAPFDDTAEHPLGRYPVALVSHHYPRSCAPPGATFAAINTGTDHTPTRRPTMPDQPHTPPQARSAHAQRLYRDLLEAAKAGRSERTLDRLRLAYHLQLLADQGVIRDDWHREGDPRRWVVDGTADYRGQRHYLTSEAEAFVHGAEAGRAAVRAQVLAILDDTTNTNDDTVAKIGHLLGS